jgi:hypothetical protein
LIYLDEKCIVTKSKQGQNLFGDNGFAHEKDIK